LSEYAELCEVINQSECTAEEKRFLKRDIKRVLKKHGKIDYRLFPPSFRWNLCAARMRLGRFDNYDGWEYRSDWSVTFQGWNGYANPLPKWMGQKVDRLLVLGEQGIGDEILFASCIPELIVRLGHKAVVFHTYPRLIPIMERSFRIECLPRKNLSDYTDGDAVVALGDLLMFYRRHPSHFPRKPYLKPDPQRVEYWKQRLSELGDKPKIGIAWRARHGRVDPESLMTEDATYINLQYLKQPDGKWEEKLPEGVVDLGLDPLEDLNDQFNLVAALDRVVTVTQTVSHVCGAIGKECLVIRPPKGTGEVNNSLWYYGTGGPMIPYGSVHVR
jgi:hypothetical protein